MQKKLTLSSTQSTSLKSYSCQAEWLAYETLKKASISPEYLFPHVLPIERNSSLLKAAEHVLSLLAYSSTLQNTTHPQKLFETLVQEIQNFERSVSKEYSTETIRIASYLLCAALDELILDRFNVSPTHSPFYLSHFLYHDSQSKMRFFKILDFLLHHSKHSNEVLTLAYYCLSLGYQGQYGTSHSKEAFFSLLDELHHVISQGQFLKNPRLNNQTPSSRDQFNSIRVRIIQINQLSFIVFLTGYTMALFSLYYASALLTY